MENIRRFEAHPLNSSGDFYVENGQCIACGVPEAVAPDLMAHTEENYYHCYWKKQPQTRRELEQAFAVFDGQEAGCHRYAGNDPEIQRRIGYESCDALSSSHGTFVAATWGTPRPSSFEQMPSSEGLLKRLWNRLKRES